MNGEDTRVVNSMRDFYSCNRHAKPRTLEDVLARMDDTIHDLADERTCNGHRS